MEKRKSKIIDFEQKKRGFDSEKYQHVKMMMYRDDVSTALREKKGIVKAFGKEHVYKTEF